MLLSLQMPQLGEAMRHGTVVRFYPAVGTAVRPGARLLDVRVDLDLGGAIDCPAISFFRIVASESGWVREVHAGNGTVKDAGAVLALLSTTPDEASAGTPARALRISTVAILPEADWAG